MVSRLDFAAAVAITSVAALAACGPHHDGNGGDGGGGTGDALTLDAFAGPFPDFPVDPIIDGSAPPTSGGLFGDPATGAQSGGPCLVEPEVGTLFPKNWLRPRFSWVASGTENLFELRLTTPNEIHPLVVYTTATTWTMPADLWATLSEHIIDQPITLTVRGATFDGATIGAGPELGSTGDIAIAPAEAPGAIVYWTTSGGTGLRGFHIGDESVTDIVRPGPASTACVGCHSSTPDGKFIGFSASANAGNGDPATLELRSADGTYASPSFITASGQTLMSRIGQEAPQFSANHWRDGDHTALAMYKPATVAEIVWVDLEAADVTSGTGIVARTGDPHDAASASFAHTSDTIVYASGTSVGAGVTLTDGDLRTVPYNNRAGGTSVAIPGASTVEFNEFYPTFSPDDRYVAYNRVATGAGSYNDAASEVYVIPSGGDISTRLAANTPPACSGKVSPGVTNSWPKWAPGTTDVGTRRFYWLTFSSTRSAAGNPQLYVTPIVEDHGALTTYPALYLWNQPVAENNHTPAWDNFDVPIQ